MAGSLGARCLLLLALLLGAALGGWTAGHFHSTRISVLQVLRCLAGGVLMSAANPNVRDFLTVISSPSSQAVPD